MEGINPQELVSKAIKTANQQYLDHFKQSLGIGKNGFIIGEDVRCFECGDKFTIQNERQRAIYESAGMCEKCEMKALGESDPTLEMLSSIIERLNRIEKLLKKEM